MDTFEEHHDQTVPKYALCLSLDEASDKALVVSKVSTCLTNENRYPEWYLVSCRGDTANLEGAVRGPTTAKGAGVAKTRSR